MSESISESAIIEFIRTYIAEEFKMSKEALDIHLPMAKLAMDSMAVTKLCSELETWLKQPVQPYLAWDYPTIQKMAAFLASERGPTQASF